jgi:osmoprotectant transport system permease protein
MNLRRAGLALPLVLGIGAFAPGAPAGQSPGTITVGSKTFTESVILGEMLRQLVQRAGHPVVYKRQLGGTRVLWNALGTGDIDAYPEYTGTLLHEILAKQHLHGEEQLRQALAARGLRMTRPLGFNNTYALGMKADLAQELGIRTISDLRNGAMDYHSGMSAGWTTTSPIADSPPVHCR